MKIKSSCSKGTKTVLMPGTWNKLPRKATNTEVIWAKRDVFVLYNAKLKGKIYLRPLNSFKDQDNEHRSPGLFVLLFFSLHLAQPFCIIPSFLHFHMWMFILCHCNMFCLFYKDSQLGECLESWKILNF